MLEPSLEPLLVLLLEPLLAPMLTPLLEPLLAPSLAGRTRSGRWRTARVEAVGGGSPLAFRGAWAGEDKTSMRRSVSSHSCYVNTHYHLSPSRQCGAACRRTAVM